MAKFVFFLSHAIFQETSPNLQVFIAVDHRNGIKMVKTAVKPRATLRFLTLLLWFSEIVDLRQLLSIG